MKMRLTRPAAATGAWLVAGRAAGGAVLLAVAVSACTGGSSSVPIFTPSPQTSPSASVSGGATRTPSPSGGASSSARASSSAAVSAASSSARASASRSASAAASSHAAASASALAHATPRVTRTVVVTRPVYPAAPETGGGGTAGLQDGLLFGVGGVAVLAGLGSLAYRRRVRRKFAARRPGAPADRETAGR
jgi:hypothetical protein